MKKNNQVSSVVKVLNTKFTDLFTRMICEIDKNRARIVLCFIVATFYFFASPYCNTISAQI